MIFFAKKINFAQNSYHTMLQKLIFTFALFILSHTAVGQILVGNTKCDFGAIEEADGVVYHTFELKNEGDRALVILDVITSCGCTVPEFSKRPIAPNATTEIKIAFDPINRSGRFQKSVAVYSTERRKVATLTLMGSIVPRERTIEERFPIDAGGGVRLEYNSAPFSYIYSGEQQQMVVGMVNRSEDEVAIELRPTKSSGALRLDYPRQIEGGNGEAKIAFIYDNGAENPKYGTLRDEFDLYVDGVKSDITISASGIGVDARVDGHSRPKAELTTQILRFGAIKRGAQGVKKGFAIGNVGDKELIVRAIEHSDKVVCGLKAGDSVAVGQSMQVEVELSHDALQQVGIITDHITIVTNDTARPMLRVRVAAIVEN